MGRLSSLGGSLGRGGERERCDDLAVCVSQEVWMGDCGGHVVVECAGTVVLVVHWLSPQRPQDRPSESASSG